LQGTGSGADAEYIDGMSYNQIVAALIPPGGIALWHGSTASIPAGWALCNGFNDTPDLRDYFVVGAGAPGYTAGTTTGGAISRTPVVATLVIGNTTLAANQIPEHNHGYYDRTNRNSNVISESTGTQYPHYPVTHTAYTEITGSGTAHGHTGSTFVPDAIENRPPYWAKAYIMKLEL
jgi:microcystin-dependent protein